MQWGDHAHSGPGLQVPDLTNFNFPSAIRVLDQFGPEAAVSEANLRYEEITPDSASEKSTEERQHSITTV